MSVQPDKYKKSLLGRFKSGGQPRRKTARVRPPNRRWSNRVELPIPVNIKVGQGGFKPRRLRNVNLLGLCIEGVGTVSDAEVAAVRFEGYPQVCEPFLLHGNVVRSTADTPAAAVIEVNRTATGEEALEQYRKLVLHFIRHRELLEDLWKGYFEARCPSCGWLGKVGKRSRICPKCGGNVVPVSS
jgi:hypothetical protein